MLKKRNIFINGVILLVSGVLCMLVVPESSKSQGDIYVTILLNCIFFSIGLTGQFLRISARGYKSQAHNKRDQLIKDGPYSFVRNPMYLGSFLISLCIFLNFLPLWIVPIISVLFLLWYAYQIHFEQLRLEEKFGSQYTDYCKDVPCFFPKASSFFKHTFFQSFQFKFGWIRKELNTIVMWVGLIVIHEGYLDIIKYPFVFFAAEIAAYSMILVIGLSLIHILCKPIIPELGK